MATSIPNDTFREHFQASDIGAQKLRQNIHVHLTNSPKRDHIYKLYLYMLEEHNCSTVTSLHVPKLKYSTLAQKQ